MKNNGKIKVGILLFNEVEVLDFAGPFEVFSLATKKDEKIFEVVTISETEKIISARNGLKVMPSLQFDDKFNLDILIIPGGYGAEEVQIKNEKVINWIKQKYEEVDLLAYVCTGVFLLAEAGILKNKKATTHWMKLDKLENEFPNLKVIRNTKFVDEGKIITSGGISAGINMSFHIISKLCGTEIAEQTARKMEYDYYKKD
ncbi:MAG TPA: DJ-1/PfpI family protein [Leeuwenhoekiella sp.]|nr:DJ-1/PfpI family protein [Leeuwenhoekiella sp.]